MFKRTGQWRHICVVLFESCKAWCFMLPCEGVRLGNSRKRHVFRCGSCGEFSTAGAMPGRQNVGSCPTGIDVDASALSMQVSRLWVRAPHMMQDLGCVRVEA